MLNKTFSQSISRAVTLARESRDISGSHAGIDEDSIGKILNSPPPIGFYDFLRLISPGAVNAVPMISKAADMLTRQRYGKIMTLYAPLYLSSTCVNRCTYCGFSAVRDIPRKTLTESEIRAEAEYLKSLGYNHILLVAGEDPKTCPAEYLAESIKTLKSAGINQVSLEAGPVATSDYELLAKAGLDGLTIYQETYDPEMYAQVHPGGPKRDYDYRLDTADRAARAGIRSIGIGVLLGLADWRFEAVALSAHVKYLQKRYWQTVFSVSFPRLKSAPKGFAIPHPVSDDELTQYIAAMRLYHPDAGLTLSTREPASLRDKLFRCGITQSSAGSKTVPGGYTGSGRTESAAVSRLVESDDISAGEQFEVVDRRSPAEVAKAIESLGLEPVWKDWSPFFTPVGSTANQP